MSKTLDIIMQLKDNVSPNLGKINGNLQTTSGKINAVGKSISKLGGLLKGVLVGGAIAKFSVDSLKAWDAQVKANEDVKRALISTGKTQQEATEGLKEYQEFASKQQSITAFGDEGTLEVISGLISQGFGKKSIEDIVSMSQDMAISTGDSQENISKALTAYIKTGKRADMLAKQYKLNSDLLGKGTTESERLAEVWDAFSKSSHMGSASAKLKTFSGQLAVVQANLDDLKEPAGEFINILLGGNSQGLGGASGAMATIAEKLVDANNAMSDFNKKANEAGGGIGGIAKASFETEPLITSLFVGVIGGKAVSAVLSLYNALKPVGTMISAVGAFCSGAVGGVLALVGAVSALVGALDYAIYKMSSYLQSSAQVRNDMNAQDNPFLSGGAVPSGVYDLSGSIGGVGKPNANGTNYFEGGRALVGEYGPEIVDLPSGSSIKTNAQTQRELSGGGNNVTVNVNVEGNMIADDVYANRIGQMICDRVSLAIANS